MDIKDIIRLVRILEELRNELVAVELDISNLIELELNPRQAEEMTLTTIMPDGSEEVCRPYVIADVRFQRIELMTKIDAIETAVDRVNAAVKDINL